MGLWVELYPLDRQFPVTDAHDDPALGACRDFKLGGLRLRCTGKRVVTAGLEPLGQSRKHALPTVPDCRTLPCLISPAPVTTPP